MADEAISDEAGTILVAGDPVIKEMTADSGADIKPGYVVEETAENDAGACAAGTSGTKPCGVALEKFDSDIDTAFSEDDTIMVALCGSGCIVRSFMDKESDQTVYTGQLTISGNSTSGAWDLAGAMTNSDIRVIIGRVGRYDNTTDGTLRIGYLMLGV